MKKFIPVLLSLIILMSMTGITAFAAVTATSVAFKNSSKNITLDVGDTFSNPAVTTPSGGRIIYTSSNTKVATVDSSGKVLCIMAGTTTIKATSGTVSDTYTLTVVGSGVLKTSRVKIYASQSWVRVGRSILLDVSVLPSNYKYDSIEWYTYDNEILEVNDSGEVTGLKPGKATVAVNVYLETSAKTVEVGSAEIEIEVRDSIVSSYSFDESIYDPDIPRVSISSKTSSTANAVMAKNEMVPTKTVNEAVKSALSAGTTTSATFKNYTSVSTVSLESAAAEMQLGGGHVLLNFDTYSADGKTAEGRLTINPRAYKPVKYDDPLQAGHSINVVLNTNDDAVSKVRNKFQKFYKNEILVIKTGQKGGYGMSVTCAVKTGNVFSKAKQSNLYLYTFDPDNGNGGTFRLVKNPNISIDSNKNLHFTTDTGNYLIISNGPLAKK